MPSSYARGLFVASAVLAANGVMGLVQTLRERATLDAVMRKRASDANQEIEEKELQEAIDEHAPLWPTMRDKTTDAVVNTVFGVLPPAYALLYALGHCDAPKKK